MDVGFRTDKGVMRSNNEDAFFVMKKDGVFIVADGVGGNKSGEIASLRAVTVIADEVSKDGVYEEDIIGFFRSAIEKANREVYNSSHRFKANKGMATTIVIACIRMGMLYVMNVGDSRAYIYTDGILKQITEDHTYVNELVKAGVITASQAKNHVDKNMITRAVGAEAEIETDAYKMNIKAGDRILLCTDGLYGEVEEDSIKAIFDQGKSMSETCLDFIDTANANGGGDNITAVCIEITEEDINE